MVCLFFVCRSWEKMFKIHESVYQEILLEFYATFPFDPRKTPDDKTTISFLLGGMSRECSAIELELRVGIYTFNEMRNVHFSKSLVDCVTGRPTEYNENVF